MLFVLLDYIADDDVNTESIISTPPNEEYEKPIKIPTGKVSKKNKRKKKDFDLDEDEDVVG